jgi:hypothetical protein
MGYIYSMAMSVVVILQGHTWEIVQKLSGENSPGRLSEDEMDSLQLDTWVSRVWTYQELVNNPIIRFTTVSPTGHQLVTSSTQLFNCIGYSLYQWLKDGHTFAESFARFPNLHNLEDTIAETYTSDYLNRSALGVFSNLGMRTFDSQYPGNRLLSSMGALTTKASWGPPATTLSELSEKVMRICEQANDYSFIYTSDERDDKAGRRWRPCPIQPEKAGQPVLLVPVFSWSSWGHPIGETQRAHMDNRGFWLENIIRLQESETMSDEARMKLEHWLYGPKEEQYLNNSEVHSSPGILGRIARDVVDVIPAMFKAFEILGFSRHHDYQVCSNGVFFPVIALHEKNEVEIFATASIRWAFGAPGLAMWKDGGVTRYSAGVFAGIVDVSLAQPLLLV